MKGHLQPGLQEDKVASSGSPLNGTVSRVSEEVPKEPSNGLTGRLERGTFLICGNGRTWAKTGFVCGYFQLGCDLHKPASH